MTADPKARKRKRLSRAAVDAALDAFGGAKCKEMSAVQLDQCRTMMCRAINAALDAQEARRAR